MKFVIVTGMSGAGKSTALKMLEDIGYFCVDNLPVPLIPKLAEIIRVPNANITKIALGLDIRSGMSFTQEEVLLFMKETKLSYQVLFLEASDDVLVKRYKETRRNHPLAGDGRVDKGLALERVQLQFLKQRADYVIDTSQMLTRDLNIELNKIFVQEKDYKNIYITILSFGFKYGMPNDADLVFDVRFLPNPYYVENLRLQTGNDREVRDFVMKHETTHVFLEKLVDMMKFLIPNYIAEGKHQLVIAIGCTGGRHRSVTMANELYENLEKEEIYGLKVEHRDISEDTRGK
ncbi:MAG: RNase adapter RapZ [Lachnospiraceae bacterium]